jgi:hypothetical protein
MIKKLTKHTIYEVYNEWAAESVFVDHDPSDEEVEFLVKKKWGDVHRYCKEEVPLQQFIRDYIHVSKLRDLYTDDNSKEFLKMAKQLINRCKEPLYSCAE